MIRVFIARVFLYIAVLLVVVVLIWAGYTSSWTGFSEKTLWDWMELFIVPVVLAAGVFLFNRAERKADRIREEKRAELEFKLAFDNAQEARLQNFLNQMTNLLLEKNLLTSKPGDEIRDIVRAHTISALNVLDGTRKATVLEFLHKSKLINGDAVISLHQASLNGLDLLFMTDLSGANLANTFLNNARLVCANLREAKLSSAYMRGTHLNGADLTGADLTDAILSEATMAEALILSGTGNVTMAELRGVVLDDPELRASDLEDVLEGVNLRGAIVTNDQLATVRSLKGAIVPDGSRYDGRFNLPGDILAAQMQGIDSDDPEAMARWYAGE